MTVELTRKDLNKYTDRELLKMFKSGILFSVTTDHLPETDKLELPSSYDALKGIPIHLGDAARKYNIAHQTLSRWVQKNYIPMIGKLGQKTLVDEAYVAWRVDQYSKNRGQGKWFLDKEGKPYKKKQD